MDLPTTFGPIDIYLFDQILRGRITPAMRILDAGCGAGRNLVYLLREGYDVWGVDEDTAGIAEARRLACVLAPHWRGMNAAAADERFRVAAVESLTCPDASFDVVLCSAVLHFARDEAHFDAMVRACWRVLRPGGLWFARLASSDGLGDAVRWLSGRRAQLPDGSERFLVDAARLAALTDSLGGTLIDPLKTTIVHGQRSMATWIARKR